VVGQRQPVVGLAGARDRDHGNTPWRGRREQRVESGLLAAGVHDTHPPVQRIQPVPGHRERGVLRRQPGFDEAAKVLDVACTPVGVLLRIAGPGRVDLAQRVGYHGAAQC
jgi:hypothetical protein